MEIIDLTHTLCEEMPVYPGTPPPRFHNAYTLDADGFREKEINFYSHTGTHMDAPAHILPEGKTLDSFDTGHFMGQAISIDLTHLGSQSIEISDFQSREKDLELCDFVLLHAGWSQYWGQEQYFKNFPVLSPQAALWLCNFNLKGIGVDMISMDGMEDHNLPVHRILLAREMVIIENLTNLASLPETSFLFSCFPLKIAGADGSPVRAVSMVNM